MRELRGIKYVEMDLLLKYFQDPSFKLPRHNEDYEFDKCYFDKEGMKFMDLNLMKKLEVLCIDTLPIIIISTAIE